MSRYRKKPVVVEAVQFLADGPRTRAVRGMTPWSDVPDEPAPRDMSWGFVTTIHGQRAHVQHGDWIVSEPDGVHFYPVKPDIFAATYEPADAGTREKRFHEALAAIVQEYRTAGNAGADGVDVMYQIAADALADAGTHPEQAEGERERLAVELEQLHRMYGKEFESPITVDQRKRLIAALRSAPPGAREQIYREALEAVVRCEARFSLDPLEHARNAVEHCREVANTALRSDAPARTEPPAERDTACEHCGSVIRRGRDGLCPVCRRFRSPCQPIDAQHAPGEPADAHPGGEEP